MKAARLWSLPELLAASGIRVDGSIPIPAMPIRQVTDDSRSVTPETLFVAVKGERVDGRRFIPEAVARGARALLLEQECVLPSEVFALKVPSTRPLMGPLLHTFLGEPSRSLKLVGITGTNGKTTVAWLIQHLMEQAGTSCGLIGTVCYQVGGAQMPSSNTTPGVVLLQGMLSEMVSLGVRACAMEVSSHALAQHRTAGLRFACGVFTNLTPEHLDYHRTLEEYLQAKLCLFEGLGSEAAAVINRDDPAWERVRDVVKGRVITCSLRQRGADFSADRIQFSLEGTTCSLRTPEGIFPVSWKLVGRHNVENLLAAVAAVVSCGVPLRETLEGVRSFSGAPGRLERVEAGQPFPVFVDYAHTDAALRRVLEQCKIAANRRILVVFGCGGDRDRTKRPRMGRAAAELADRVIITSDNPRSEDPAEIAQQVAAGLKGAPIPWEILLDRKEAIRAALESADEGWLVLIAGKGHETGQICGDRIVPFDDRAVVRELWVSR